MGSRSAFLAGSLIFSEEATEDILDHRAELLDEIDRMQEEIQELYDVKNLPQQILLRQAELSSLEVKRIDRQAEIENLYEKKKQDLINSLYTEGKKLQGRNEKYKKTGEKLKGEIKALHIEKIDIEESITLKEAAIDVIDNDIIQAEKERDAIVEGAKVLLKQAQDVMQQAKNEKISQKEAFANLNKQKKALKEETEAFRVEKVDFARNLNANLDRDRKKLNELQSNLEKESEHNDRQKSEAAVARREIEAIGEHQKIEREELRAWRLTLDKREEVITKREEDLDTNWTIFEQSKGGK